MLSVRLGTPARLVLSSEDVIHSFFVPAFRMKQDVVPGKVVSESITPTRIGTYTLFCAQYCGTQHAKMLLRVYVDSREDFDRWIHEQSQPAVVADSISEGQKIFEQTACISCHTIAGTPASGMYGPDLTHLMSRQTIAAGAAANTPANLAAWIYNPATFNFRSIFHGTSIAVLTYIGFDTISTLSEEVENPRVEFESHYYRAAHTQLLDLGLVPHLVDEALIHSLFAIADRHKDRARVDAIRPSVRWRATTSALAVTP